MARDSQGWPPESVLNAGDASEANASGFHDTPRQRWYQCARCHFIYPMNETIIEENTKKRVCKKDYDPIDKNDPRQRGIHLSRMFPGSEEVTTDGAE